MGWYLGHKGLLAPTPPSQCGHVARINRARLYLRAFVEEGEKLTTTGNMGQHIVFLFLRFCTFFKIFHVRLGKKGKMLVFTYVYVCVKAKLTFVSFVFLFFCTFPLEASFFCKPPLSCVARDWFCKVCFLFHDKRIVTKIEKFPNAFFAYPLT